MSGKEVLSRGKNLYGLSSEESIHNLLFVLGFNAFGGFSVFLPSLLSALLSDTTGLQERLRKEAREKGGSTLSINSVKEMPLVESVVYETLRLNPPVPLQYGRARKDFQLSSHDSVYDIKKGELLCGYQALAMRDSKIFDDPESFKPDRFVGEKGSELLNYLYWSNGPQTGSPSESNKQCAAKDYVVLTASLIVAYLFRRYDSITGASGSITAVEKAK
jgi:hydroperoxide lyase